MKQGRKAVTNLNSYCSNILYDTIQCQLCLILCQEQFQGCFPRAALLAHTNIVVLFLIVIYFYMEWQSAFKHSVPGVLSWVYFLQGECIKLWMCFWGKSPLGILEKTRGRSSCTIAIIMHFSERVMMAAFQMLSDREIVNFINRHARKKQNYKGKKCLASSKGFRWISWQRTMEKMQGAGLTKKKKRECACQ